MRVQVCGVKRNIGHLDKGTVDDGVATNLSCGA
jgi:hypothetical protein